MSLNSNITEEEVEKLLCSINNAGTVDAIIWLHDVDVNSNEVIGLEIVKDILCLTISKYEETAEGRTYKAVSQFAVNKEAFQSALDCLDIIEK